MTAELAGVPPAGRPYIRAVIRQIYIYVEKQRETNQIVEQLQCGAVGAC